jgi:hypothetical protein
MLGVLETERRLRWTSSGQLVPWLGPALRGQIAAAFRRAVCRFSPVEQETTWRYCKGCPHRDGCPYGETVEADPPAGASVVSGQEDGVRPLTLAPSFPAPPAAVPGAELRLRVLFSGAAARHADEFWGAAAVSGRDPHGGLGPDRVHFEIWPPAPPNSPAQWHTVELPSGPEQSGGVVPYVTVALTAPLFLRQQGPVGRGLVTRPTFADLLRASLRTVGRLCAYYGQAISDAAFRRLKDAAAAVSTRSASFGMFRQRKWSNRSQQGAMMTGVTGAATYGPVPMGLIPWLRWGGLLHVGPHRIAGAGGWEVFVGPADAVPPASLGTESAPTGHIDLMKSGPW